MGIELDISDSGREGCAVSTLTITAEPKSWRAAVQVAVQEVRRAISPVQYVSFTVVLLYSELCSRAGGRRCRWHCTI